ncbi:hypothetical protein HMPREF1990_01417 [Porphyromonas gingivalis W4087]|nr:hypothetical protein HMPREF1554_02226 [Porphyromonas gingivalis F0569]ERJ88279.1 hypothetical protein HMPREF1990_01417 [Porphyromonas gingivalis W4087]
MHKDFLPQACSKESTAGDYQMNKSDCLLCKGLKKGKMARKNRGLWY